MKKIKIQSPTRVDLAGGTLDMWPLYNFVSGAVTINVAIDIWTTVEISETPGPAIVLKSPDLNREWSFTGWPEFEMSLDPSAKFFQTVLKPFSGHLQKSKQGFVLTTASQSPIGGGLGGSSSLTISILKAFYAFCEIALPSANELVYLAHNLEAQILRTPTGTQDYYPAVTGGVGIIEYKSEGIRHEILSSEGSPIEDHFLLVYTGKSHHSGLNNFEVLKSAVQGDATVLKALSEIKQISEDMKETLLHKNWSAIPELFRREFAARIQLTPAFTSPEIERLSEICLAAGAQAVKICGAGGGGCVLVWVPPENRERVVSACKKESFQCLNAKPVTKLI